MHRKVRRALRQEGLGGAAQIGWRKLHEIVSRMNPSVRRARRARQIAERDFDLRFGVETAGLISLAELQIDNHNWQHGNRYEPIAPGVLRAMMDAAPDVARGRTFIDFGCGKGRALFLASE